MSRARSIWIREAELYGAILVVSELIEQSRLVDRRLVCHLIRPMPSPWWSP